MSQEFGNFQLVYQEVRLCVRIIHTLFAVYIYRKILEIFINTGSKFRQHPQISTVYSSLFLYVEALRCSNVL